MLTDLILYLLILLAFAGFFLVLLFAHDSQTEAERGRAQHTVTDTNVSNLVGYGILAGMYLVLILCARFIGNRQT